MRAWRAAEAAKAGPVEPKPPVQFLRCPVCGRLEPGPGLANAGEHRLDAATCKGLGYGKGFKWTFTPATADHRRGLAVYLWRALDQLMDADPAASSDEVAVEVERRVAVEVERRVAASYQEGYRVGYAEGVRRVAIRVEPMRRVSWRAERKIERRDAALVVGRQETASVLRRVLVEDQTERRQVG